MTNASFLKKTPATGLFYSSLQFCEPFMGILTMTLDVTANCSLDSFACEL